VEGYIDHGVSVVKAAGTRTRFAALLADAHKRRFDMVLCWVLDRLSREGMVATVGCLQQLEASGMSLHSYSEPLLSTITRWCAISCSPS
jgi:DNA invertase Pin-like site-specific DNA recombinase